MTSILTKLLHKIFDLRTGKTKKFGKISKKNRRSFRTYALSRENLSRAKKWHFSSSSSSIYLRVPIYGVSNSAPIFLTDDGRKVKVFLQSRINFIDQKILLAGSSVSSLKTCILAAEKKFQHTSRAHFEQIYSRRINLSSPT